MASSFTIDPAAILRTWWETNHWAGVTAAGIFLAMVTATWKMGEVKNETRAQMISDLFKTGRYIVAALLFIEYYSLILKFLAAIVDLVD